MTFELNLSYAQMIRVLINKAFVSLIWKSCTSVLIRALRGVLIVGFDLCVCVVLTRCNGLIY